MTEAYIGLGSNVGDRVKNVERGVAEIAALPDTRVTAVSSLYLTPPWGKLDQDEFVNRVIAVDTGLRPLALLEHLKQIEIKMGRREGEKWGPRVIDLDILWYGGQQINLPQLQIPHPYLRERLFVLIPLEEVNSDLILPEDGMTVKEVLARVLEREQSEIKKME
ncbi:MAG: 2-amino-4-hydroxy-6-hydroxymethyldihydropteridine diphosphokinase [Syntrophomonadaceae bacterium]|jgi:2-amino-4-hydroxy-6-hydroxymethyldihydropteridine diphosphokinase|nr:2-amino-4-hydroxy-6-hydroxymethyldihydropteridine diphosphokinase [Syntrophomonadaceae bacterium]